MANVSDYLEKACLDWAMGGASPTRPTAWYVGLGTAAPNASAGSELTMAGYTRQTVTFGAAASPAGTVSNAATMSFGPFSTGCTLSGIQVWDASAAGNMLWYGVLATPRTLGAGDSITFAAAAVTASLT